MAPTTIRLAEARDLPAVCTIINYYIERTTINFRTAPQTPEEWTADWMEYHRRYPWLVATEAERVVGIAYATPWEARAAYDWCTETTVYVGPGSERRGIGRRLYQRLFELMDRQGYHSQVAVIALPNESSVALHEAFGFRHVGTLREAGHKHGAWRDVGLWQRSTGTSHDPARPLLPVPGV